MGHLVNVLLSIDEAHILPQRAMEYGPGLGGLNQVMGPTVRLPCLEYLCE